MQWKLRICLRIHCNITYLRTEEQKERFVQLCKSIYQSIELKYSGTLGALQFADKTGFSVPSVLKIMRREITK